MGINRYFSDEHLDLPMPHRVFARSVEFQPEQFEIFDAIDADALEYAASGQSNIFHPIKYGSFVREAPIYSIEIRASPVSDATFEFPWGIEADEWLDGHSSRPDWLEINLTEDAGGPAEVFLAAEGVGRRARIDARAVTPVMANALDRATDLSRFYASDSDIEDALPSSAIEGVVVVDVGQGSSAALIDDRWEVVGYVDVGAGIRNDKGTWPAAMGPFCVQRNPCVVLTHWHEDHFHGANKTSALQSQTWIAPDQKLSPGPQAAMASAIGAMGTLMVWPRQGTLRRGQLALERCLGSNQNRSGIAVWIDHPRWDANERFMDPILLPGDAGYKDIPGLVGGMPRRVHSFAVAHHGGQAVGKPPVRPGNPDARAAFSYGPSNQYIHPLARTLAALIAASWNVGHNRKSNDDPRTEDRQSLPLLGGGLGHIGLAWGQKNWSVSCTCGCTLSPTQF